MTKFKIDYSDEIKPTLVVKSITITEAQDRALNRESMKGKSKSELMRMMIDHCLKELGYKLD